LSHYGFVAGPLVGAVEELDRALFSLINNTLHSVWLDVVMPALTEKWNFLIPATPVVLYVLVRGRRRDRLIVVGAVGVLLLVDATATALRGVIARVRPCHVVEGVRMLVGCSESFSFPSNHAANSFALVTFLAVAYRWLVIPMFVVAAAVAYSRVYVGVHFPSDVLAGAVLGTTVAFGLAVGGRSVARRWQRRTEPEGRRRATSGCHS